MLERDALERFVEQYADRAYRFAYGLCGNEPDARELVQEAFVKVFDRAALYDESQPLESWFLTVLKNVFRDGVRRWERRSRVSLDIPLGGEGLSVADAVGDPRDEPPLDRLEREEDLARLRGAIRSLPPPDRGVLMLVDVEGLRYEEAGRVLGWPLNTVRSRVFRARAAVRKTLAEPEVRA